MAEEVDGSGWESERTREVTGMLCGNERGEAGWIESGVER